MYIFFVNQTLLLYDIYMHYCGKHTNLLITLADTTLHSASDMSRTNAALVCIDVCTETRQTSAAVLRRVVSW